MKKKHIIDFDSKLSKNIQKIATILIVIASLVFVYGLIASYTNMHSAKYINVEVVSKTTECKPSNSYYSDGTRYIYLEFEAETKKLEVDSIDLYLNVSDTNGKDLGRLSVNLGSNYNRLDLSKGDKQTIKISWSDDGLYWGDEELFEALYNTNFSELTFTCEIWRIEFSDDYTYTN